MAMIAVMMGGFSGFLSFLVAWIGFGFGIFAAGGLYLVVGLAMACLILSIGALPRRGRPAQARAV